MAANSLQATCDGCGQQVEIDDLFSFDCTCAACGAVLSLEDDERFADEAPPPSAPEPRDIEEEELFCDRPTKSDTLLPLAPLYDLPTKADTEDPYALAAQALDSSVAAPPPSRSGMTSRHVTSRRTTQAITAYSEDDLTPPAPALVTSLSGSSVTLLPGTPSEDPPLPSWDDTAKLRQPPPTPAGDLEGLVEVFEVPAGGTAGRGSRTYEREEVLAHTSAGAEAPEALPAPVAAPPAPPATTAAFERGATTRVGRPTGALFGDQDLDWLALIDDNLPESDAPDGDSKPRVMIRLPETAAPTDAADSEQVKQFEQAIRNLEAGGPGAIDSLLAGTGALSDTRNARRFRGESTQSLAGAPAATQPHKKKPEEDTKSWEVDPEKSPLPARPPSGRNEQAKPARRPGSGPKTVDSFRHEDLDPALVCARDASSPDSDRFRQLVQRIFHPNEGTPPRIVMVTSPRPGDGTTTVAANLAIAAAGRLPGRGAVLVDADPRGRGLLRSFGVLTRTEGLLEALRGGEGVSQEPRDYVLQFSLGALDVVPLGIPGSDAAELLASERMGTFLSRLKDAYPNAVIIVDASAVLHAADPLVLARSVDGVVLVARADRTAREDVRRAMEMLGPRRVLGLVLNDAGA